MVLIIICHSTSPNEPVIKLEDHLCAEINNALCIVFL